MKPLSESELILNAQNKVYHLDLNGEQIADTVFLVGDPERVQKVSAHFSKIEFKTAHREFITHTGIYEGRRLTVLSTGIGTDNIDIVLNELDAAVNIDLETRQEKKHKRHLNLIRLGTSGALQDDLPVNTLVASSYGLGLDGLMHFYKESGSGQEDKLVSDFMKSMRWPEHLAKPYCYKASDWLLGKLPSFIVQGITATASGFYAPQGREIRLKASLENLNEHLAAFRFGALKITNFEMETSALYGLGKLLGHNCLTVCVIIANRIRKEFSSNLNQSEAKLIENCLHQFSQL